MLLLLLLLLFLTIYSFRFEFNVRKSEYVVGLTAIGGAVAHFFSCFHVLFFSISHMLQGVVWCGCCFYLWINFYYLNVLHLFVFYNVLHNFS